MKKKSIILIAFSLFFLLSLNAGAETDATTEPTAPEAAQTEEYYDTSNRDDAARDAKLLEEAEKTWKSKPPHQHTLEDAKTNAKHGRANGERHLLRDETKEAKIQENMEKNFEENMKRNMEEVLGEEEAQTPNE